MMICQRMGAECGWGRTCGGRRQGSRALEGGLGVPGDDGVTRGVSEERAIEGEETDGTEEAVVESDEGTDEGEARGGTDGSAGALATLEKTGIDDGDSGGRTDGSVIGDDEAKMKSEKLKMRKGKGGSRWCRRKDEIALDAGTEGDEGETGTEG
jgi:hypothetical protein